MDENSVLRLRRPGAITVRRDRSFFADRREGPAYEAAREQDVFRFHNQDPADR